MRRYLLDTGIASDFVNGRKGVPQKVKAADLAGDRVGICIPVLGELWAGVEYSQTGKKNRARLRKALLTLLHWPFDKAAAEEYGRIFATLRRLGRPIEQIDIQIAAVALTLGNCMVVTKDQHFSFIPGLAVEDWATP